MEYQVVNVNVYYGDMNGEKVTCPTLPVADPLDNKLINVDDLGDWYEVAGTEEFDLVLRPASEIERSFKEAQIEYQNAKRLFEQREKELEDEIYSTRSKKSKKTE